MFFFVYLFVFLFLCYSITRVNYLNVVNMYVINILLIFIKTDIIYITHIRKSEKLIYFIAHTGKNSDISTELKSYRPSCITLTAEKRKDILFIKK